MEASVAANEEINRFVELIREAARQSNNGVAYEWSSRMTGVDREMLLASHRILSQEIFDSILLPREKDMPFDQEG